MHALHFSGGLDSLAVLWLLRPDWERLHVFWVNTGAAYESTIAYMQRVRALVPHFHEVAGDQPAGLAREGWPVDVVPVSATALGRAVHGTTGRTFQSYLDCCSRHLWAPLRAAMVGHGVTHVYRGQRQSDTRKSPIRSGTVDEFGVTYLFPIETWTREQVHDYCASRCPEWIPEHYAAGERTSRDCWNCTAYLDENTERIEALPPERRSAVHAVLNDWRACVARDMATGVT